MSHHPDCGPVFGAGADLFICDKCDEVGDSYSNLSHSYDGDHASSTCLMGEYSFMVEEYEVMVPMQGSYDGDHASSTCLMGEYRDHASYTCPKGEYSFI